MGSPSPSPCLHGQTISRPTGEPSPAAPAQGNSLLSLPTGEPWPQLGTPLLFLWDSRWTPCNRDLQEGGLSPQKQLHPSSAAALPPGGTYRSPGALRALQGQCRAAGTAPGCAGPARTGETLPRGAGAQPCCNTGTATVGRDRTRTQGRPSRDGTGLGETDSHYGVEQDSDTGAATTGWDSRETQGQPPQGHQSRFQPLGLTLRAGNTPGSQGW